MNWVRVELNPRTCLHAFPAICFFVLKYTCRSFLAFTGLPYAKQDDLATPRRNGSDGIVAIHYL